MKSSEVEVLGKDKRQKEKGESIYIIKSLGKL
jgi:hypothetical protein